eukprot:11214203-Lingulodinium_polyedra.AAC.1
MGELHCTTNVDKLEHAAGALEGLRRSGVRASGGPASSGRASVLFPSDVGLELGLACEPYLTCMAEHG